VCVCVVCVYVCVIKQVQLSQSITLLNNRIRLISAVCSVVCPFVRVADLL
jgi:hypothetical protein